MVAVLSVVTICTTAAAAPVMLPVDVSEGGAQWESIENDATDGFHINDAAFAGLSDAYDSAFGIRVDGTVLNPGNAADQAEVIVSGSVVGTAISSSAQAISNLSVTQQFLFYRDPVMGSPTVRILVGFTNSTNADINAAIELFGNLGSDGSTTTDATASGDTTVDATDRWVVSNGDTSDPVNTIVYFGPGAPTVTAAAITGQGSGNDDFQATYNISVPAGQTRFLMFFAQLSVTISDAISSATVFDTVGSLAATTLVCDLTPDIKAGILNFTELSGCGTLMGTVWNDANNNGIRDAGESTVPNITVNLLDASGTTVHSTRLTDPNGVYDFGLRGATDFVVEVLLPLGLGLSFSPQDQGGNDAVDSDVDPATGRGTITTQPNVPSALDAGMVILALVMPNGSGQPAPCGVCGPGAVAMMPLAIAGLAIMKRKRRR